MTMVYLEAPLVPRTTSYSIHWSHGSTEYSGTVSLTVGAHVYPDDLAAAAAAVMTAVTPSRTYTATRTAGGHVRISVDSGTFALLWDVSPSTTLRDWLGWQASTGAASSHTAPLHPQGSWHPGRRVVFDSGLVPQYIASHAVTASGESRGHYYGSTSMRELRWTLVPRAQVVDGPRALYAAYDWWLDGRPVRVYDETGSTEWVVVPPEMPTPSSSRQPRYDVTMRLRPRVQSATNDTALFSSEASRLYATASAITGLNDYSLQASFSGAGALTIAAWVQPTSDWSGYQNVLYSPAQPVVVGEPRVTQVSCSLSSFSVLGGNPITEALALVDDWRRVDIGVWMHVAWRFDGGASPNQQKVRIFWNGTDVSGTQGIGQSWTTIRQHVSPATCSLGRPESTQIESPFRGAIDDLAIWYRALSNAEIAALATSTLPPTGAAHLWTMERTTREAGGQVIWRKLDGTTPSYCASRST